MSSSAVSPLSPREIMRSEERRVGKECRSRGLPYHKKKNHKRDEILPGVFMTGSVDPIGRILPVGALPEKIQGFVFFFQAEDGIRDRNVTGVQTCALPISTSRRPIRASCCRRMAYMPCGS